MKYKLQGIFLFAILARVFAIYYYRDVEIANEWGIMVKNLEDYKILSIHSIQGNPVPNIFMPPLYPLFLYCVKIFFQNIDLFLWSVQFIQLIFAIITIYLAFKILQEFFSNQVSLIGTLLFSLFPLNIYAVSQISSITLQLLLLNLFLFSFIKLFRKISLGFIVLFSFSSGFLMLLRGEFFIFVLLTIFYIYLKQKNLTKIILISLITLLIISPYLYRNYQIFGVITITKSGGYNLLKGNHPKTRVEGTPMFLNIEKIVPEVKPELEKLISRGPIQDYDLVQDKILLNQAIKFIQEDPSRYIKLYFKKFASFMLIDLNANYKDYYSPLHIIPKLILGITTIIGIALSLSFKVNTLNYFMFYYFSNIGLFSIFFILPRYSLSLLIIQVIFSMCIIKKLKPNL